MQTSHMESENKKRVLITGKDSYVGTSVKRYLEQTPELFEAQELDVRTDDWEQHSFQGYDVVFHVAGIVHRKKAPEELYFKVNRDLVIDVAKKAKSEGVCQFIFMSTIAVYGKDSAMSKNNLITRDTPLTPKNAYGKSKLEAECGIQALEDESFKVCILRPPMIYGEGCPGNYQTLRKITLALGVIPAIENERSMAHINTLCGYVKQCIADNKCGIYCPQDAEYVNTSNMMKQIAQEHGRKVHESRLLGACVRVGAVFLPVLRKAFGSLKIDV